MKTPYKPLSRIHTPEWMKNARTASVCFGPTTPDKELERIARESAGLGVSVLLMEGNRRAFFREPERIRKIALFTRLCHENGMKAIHHDTCCCLNDTIEKERSWEPIANVDARTGNPIYCECYDNIEIRGYTPEEITQMGSHAGLLVCINNPEFRNLHIESCEHLLRETAVDGFMVDEVSFYPGWYSCQCAVCRKLFREEAGMDVPAYGSRDWENFDSPKWRKWLDFRYRHTARLYYDLYSRLMKIKKDQAFFACFSDPTRAYCQWTGATMDRWIKAFNVLFYEATRTTWVYFSYRPLLAEMKYVSAMADCHNVPALTIMPGFLAKETFLSWATIDFSGHRSWALPKGNGRYLGHNIVDHEDMTAEFSGIFQWQKRNEEYLVNPTRCADIGILFSHPTRDFHAGHSSRYYEWKRPEWHEFEYEKPLYQEWTGWCEQLLDAQIHFDAVVDDDLIPSIPGHVRTLILPNAACMSRTSAEAIRQFVNDGGTLVATSESSLYDETGARLKDFSLSDVIGVSWESTKFDENAVGFDDSEHDLTGVHGEFFHRAPQALVRPQSSAKAIGHILTADRGDTGHPAMVINEYGKGRAIYMSFRPGVMSFIPAMNLWWTPKWFDKRISEYGTIIETTINGTVDNRFVRAENLPRGVVINAFKHESNHTVHLLNFVGSRHEMKYSLYTRENFKLRHPEIAERNGGKDIVISVRVNNPSKAFLMSPDIPDAVDLKITPHPDSTEIRIPPEHVRRYVVIVVR